MSQSEDFLGRLAEVGYQPRDGQLTFWQIVAMTMKPLYTAIWTTGYGKSDGGLGAYLITRLQGRCGRLLITVPTTTQRDQYVESLKKSVARLGANVRVFTDPDSGDQNVVRFVSGQAADLRLSWENQCEIFVTTIQFAMFNEAHLADLMSKGQWMVFHDEFHKLNMSEDAKWGAVARRLSNLAQVVIGMTATPNRTDGTPTLFDGVVPDSMVTRKEAYQEKAIRGVRAHVEHYNLQVEDIDGKPAIITTEDLAAFGSYDDYELKKGLRYDDNYLNDILTRSVQCLAQKNMVHPGQHQMLVFAMSLRHAEHVARVLKANFGDNFADWVGISRNDGVNREVFRRYQQNKLECLVQVEKAMEGFDNVRASVGVFLTLLRKNTVKMNQGAGRTSRRNSAINPFEMDIADLFASPDTEAAEYIIELAQMTTNDVRRGEKRDDGEDKGGEDGDGGDGQGGIRLGGIDPIISKVLGSEHDHSDLYHPTPEDVEAARAALDERGYDVSDEQVERVLREINRGDEVVRANRRAAASAQLNKTVVEGNVRRVAADVASLLLNTNTRDADWKKLCGILCGTINGQWLRGGGRAAKDSLADDLEKKQAWLQAMSDEMVRTREVPAWLRARGR